MESQVDITAIKNLIRRKKKIFFLIFTPIFLTALMIAFLYPAIYRSQVGIVVEEQQIPENYVRSTITSYVEERIEMITQQVMSRSKLLDIIDKHDLYIEMRKKGAKESELVSLMRKNIDLETMTANVGKRNEVTIGFTLSYSGRNPEKLQSVANELAYLYLEEEHRTKEQQASVTTDFLKQELKNFKEHIDYLENKISDFKKKNIGKLPQNYSSNLQAFNRLENNLDRIEPEIRSLEERKLYLKTQIANIEPLKPIMLDGKNVMMSPADRLKRLRLELISMKSSYSDKHPDIKKIENEVRELEGKVEEGDNTSQKIKTFKALQGELSKLKSRLGEKHPDVVKAEKEYKTLSSEVDKLMEKEVAVEYSNVKPDNPVYINLMTQIVTIDSKIKGYLDEKKRIKKELIKYQELLEKAPLIEKEYNDLTRDHGMAMKKYNELLGKLMQAQVALGMESAQRGERFAISEPASYPGKPYKPNRVVIIVLGFMLAVGAGVSLSALQEVMDDTLKDMSEITKTTGLQVLSNIPFITTEEEKQKNKKKVVILTVVLFAFVILTIIIVDMLIMPLDIIWAKIINRLIVIGVPL